MVLYKKAPSYGKNWKVKWASFSNDVHFDLFYNVFKPKPFISRDIQMRVI